LSCTAQRTVGNQVTLHQVLQRGRHEKIFLPQPEFAPGGTFVVRIKEFADRFGARLLGRGADIVAGIEHIELERIGRACRPQPQRIDALATPSDDRGVIRHRLHGFRRMPDRVVAAFLLHMLDTAAEMDVVDHLRPLEFPGVAEAQPFVRIFLLPALIDDLAEQAEIVADAIADRGNAEGGHAFHEACRKPAEAAIAQCRVRLAFAQFRESDAEIAKRGLEHREQPHVVERVGEQTADQKLQREIVDPLAAGIVALLLRRQPAMHDAVAQRQRGRLVPVVPGRHAGVLADGEPQLGKDGALDFRQRQLIDGLTRRRKIHGK
jgi:hypothetical protein